MGRVIISVNHVSGSMGHAYVAIETSSWSGEIHGEPNGNAIPGGVFALFGDSVGINVEERKFTGENKRSEILATDIPDQFLRYTFESVLADAQRHFSNAQYEVPRLADPVRIPSGSMAHSLRFGELSIPVFPSFLTIDRPILKADERFWDVQNSNTVARWVATAFIERLRAAGYPARDLPDRTLLSPDLKLPGWDNPATSLRPPVCFPAHTPIAVSLTATRPIAEIRVGDTVLAFDPSADLGRGALVPRRVARLYRNTTDTWIRLRWTEDGEARELVATPGHHRLDRFGNFPPLETMIANGRATVVLASGALAEVTAERIIFSSAVRWATHDRAGGP